MSENLDVPTVHLATVACVKQPYCVHACCQRNQNDVVHVLDVIQNPSEQHAANIPNVSYNGLRPAQNKRLQQLHVEVNLIL